MNSVFVGLSGGVDSAVSAAILKEQGYGVTGVFIKIWQPEFIECTWREDRLDAMRVAAALGIPFCELDLSEEYKLEVVDKMVADYARGITPNPDIACNRAIKFGHFLKWARSEGADCIATGHYARIGSAKHDESREYFGFRKPEYSGFVNPNMLLRGKDANKDQSYFLYQLTEDDLAHTLFPIGDLMKQEVRSLAKKFGLSNAEKPDSQGICFLGDVSVQEFLGRFIPLEHGKVLDMAEREVGEHNGAALYTVGQRHGFTVRGAEGDAGQHYVIAVDTRANTITVSNDRLYAARTEIKLENVHWINARSLPLEAEAQARYREAPARVHVEERSGATHVVFSEPHLVAPGQSLVLYKGERCLGGGTILR